MEGFIVKVTITVPEKKKPEETKVISFISQVFAIDTRMVYEGGAQVSQSFFLVCGDDNKFIWFPSEVCKLIPEEVSEEIKTLTPNEIITLISEEIKTLTPVETKTLTPEEIKTLIREETNTLTPKEIKALILEETKLKKK